MFGPWDGGKDLRQKRTDLCISRIFISFWRALFTKLHLGERSNQAAPTSLFQEFGKASAPGGS
jgi:hypothetical protein